MKIRITRIGTVQKDGTVRDWTFDGTGYGPQKAAIHIDKKLIGGYSVAELREISCLNHKLEQLTKGGK